MTEMPTQSPKAADSKVQLGCGTLVIIAIIVMIFSGDRDSSRTRRQIEELNTKMDRLEQKIDELSRTLEADEAQPTEPSAPTPESGS